MNKVLAVVAALAACHSSSDAPPKRDPTPPRVLRVGAPTVHHSEVTVDLRIELVSIVEHLAGTSGYDRPGALAYTAEVDKAFGPLAKHPTIIATRELAATHGIAFDAPMILAVHLDEQLHLRPGAAEEIVAQDKRWLGVDLAHYAESLAQFAADAKAAEFFAAHRDYYAAVGEAIRKPLDAENPGGWFDDYFGPSGARFIVVPGLLEGPMNFGVRCTLGGARELYQVIGVDRGDPQGLPVVDVTMIELLVHEMAHSFINPLFERHLAELLPAGEKIYALVEDAMKRQAYADAKTMLDESGVRAIVVAYVRAKRGPAAGEVAARAEAARSFVWTAGLADVMGAYPRSGVHDLDAYMPRIAAFFDARAAEYAKGLPAQAFAGTANGVTSAPLVVVLPSDAAVAAYATQIHDRFFKRAPLVASAPAVLGKYAGVGAVAYGSPASNSVVADTVARAGWKIERERIALGALHWDGPGLALIAVWPRLDDPTRGILVYTAGDDATLVGVNSVMHGQTDWVVARKGADGTFKGIEAGTFRGPGGAWVLPK